MHKIYKTFKELYEARPNNLPFIYRSGKIEFNNCYPMNDKQFTLNEDSHIYSINSMSSKPRHYVDWFDAPPTKPCTHDRWHYDILLKKPCPCYE